MSFTGMFLPTTIRCGLSEVMNTGDKSVAGSKPEVLSINGLISKLPLAQTNSVYPSAGDFITKSIATVPVAPARFSTTTETPVCWLKPSAAMRAMRSVVPPGTLSTINLMGRFGNGVWASTNVDMHKHANAVNAVFTNEAVCKRAPMLKGISSSPVCTCPNILMKKTLPVSNRLPLLLCPETGLR